MKTTSGFVKHCFAIAFLLCCLSANAENNAVFALVCPADQYVTCEDEIWDLSIYGNAYVSSYGGPQSAGDPVVVWNLNGCNVGEIHRTWTVEDYNWNIHTCTQIIYVSGTGSFNQNNITWPQNTSLEGCDPLTDPEDLPPGSQYPSFWEPACSNVGVTYSDQIFQISNTCHKLRRTWQVIDLCQYKGSGSGSGVFTFIQDIKLTQEEVPIVNCIDTIFGKTHKCVDAEVFASPLEVAPNSCGTEFTVTNNSPFADNGGANLSGIYPLGNTPVTFTIHYGCNRRAYCHVNVYVEDTSVPTPYCIAKIHTALMPVDTDNDGQIDNGMLEVWASEFDLGSSSPCGHSVIQSFSPDEVLSVMNFDCDDVGENSINIYQLDSNGNSSFCTVVLDIQNNSQIPNCEPVIDTGTKETARISGVVESLMEEDLGDVLVECVAVDLDTTYINEIDTVVTNVLTDSFVNASGVTLYIYDQILEINEINDTIISETREQHFIVADEYGAYAFDSVAMHKNYTISARCNEEDMTLIDQCDLEKLIDHVQGIEIITDEKLLFAADIDENDQIDFDDIKALMFYLGGITNSLPYEKAIYIFPTDVESYNHETHSSHDFLDLASDKENTDFTYIMKGNLCTHDFNSQQFPGGMNILTAFSEKLPARFRNEISSEIRKVSEPTEFSLYPNPFSNSFVVNIDNPKAQIVSIEVYDTNGQKVYRRSAFVDRGFQSLDNDLENEPSGVYFYKIQAGETQFHGKVMKQ